MSEWQPIDADHPAFPQDSDTGNLEGWRMGMTLRDYFAGQAVIALGAQQAVITRAIPWIAEHAYMLADELLRVRGFSKPDNRPEPPKRHEPTAQVR